MLSIVNHDFIAYDYTYVLVLVLKFFFSLPCLITEILPLEFE